jgi:hypothetical protein
LIQRGQLLWENDNPQTGSRIRSPWPRFRSKDSLNDIVIKRVQWTILAVNFKVFWYASKAMRQIWNPNRERGFYRFPLLVQ